MFFDKFRKNKSKINVETQADTNNEELEEIELLEITEVPDEQNLEQSAQEEIVEIELIDISEEEQSLSRVAKIKKKLLACRVFNNSLFKEKLPGFGHKLIKIFGGDHTEMTIGVSVASVIFIATGVIIVTGITGGKKHAAKEVAAIDQTETLGEVKAPTLSLYLEAVADENTITAKVYDEDGQVLTGHELVFNLLKGSKEENQAQIEKIKNTYVGQNVDDVEADKYDDDDKDGTVLMPDLETGTYTLVVQAEKGYQTPDATEATIETFEVMDNIMEKVVQDSAETQKEDPSRRRGSRSTAGVVPETTASQGSVGVTVLKKSGDSIVYKVKDSSNVSLTDQEISGLTSGSILIDKDGNNSSYSGYIYETGTVKVTEGEQKVITKFLVPENVYMSADVNTGNEGIVLLADTANADSGIAVAADTVSETSPAESSGQKESTTGESNSQTATHPSESATTKPTESTAAKKKFVLLNVEAETESVYANGWQNIGGKKYYFQDSKAVTGWRKIDGLQYYFNSDGSLGSSLVIDVSTYNGDIDWNSVKASGIDYAIIRVGYRGYETARLVKDKRFDTNMSNATAAGVKVGAYIVTQAVNTSEAVEEASFIISACRGYNISLPLAIDVESAGGGAGRGDKISASERTAVINAFAQTVQSAGYSPMVYANKNWMSSYINAGSVSCPVWLAQYNSTCTYGGSFLMWQFTESGSIPGISYNVDISAWKH